MQNAFAVHVLQAQDSLQASNIQLSLTLPDSLNKVDTHLYEHSPAGIFWNLTIVLVNKVMHTASACKFSSNVQLTLYSNRCHCCNTCS